MTVQTGVGFILSCAHRDKATGKLHGHTYEVTCWFDPVDGVVREAEALRVECVDRCKHLDHSTLPDHLAWAEALLEEVRRLTGAAEVIVARPLERLYARDR